MMESIRRSLFKTSLVLSAAIGSEAALTIAILLCVLWVLLGFFVGFKNDTYQFAANTPLSWAALFVTILVLISTRHENRALHLKLDEIILSIAEARNEFLGIEKAEEDTLERLAETHEAVDERNESSE